MSNVQRYAQYITEQQRKLNAAGHVNEEEEIHDTVPYKLSHQSFKSGMRASAGAGQSTVHIDNDHHVRETEAGDTDESDNVVYGIHDKKTGKVHGVSISLSKKTTPEKVAKAAGSSTVHPAHKALAQHHNENYGFND